MAAKASLALVDHFAGLTDPRRDHALRHNLIDIVVVAVCGVICGCRHWVEIEDYGHEKRAWLERFLELPNGIPSHDTFGRVFARLKPAEFQACFTAWMAALAEAVGLKQVAIDGKALRRSQDRASGKAALHLVSAWAAENRLVLGQVAVGDKSNEIAAIPRLLEVLDLSGAIVSLDAMGCQKEIAEQIRGAGADYVIAVKENQGRLHEDIDACFRRGLETDFAGMAHSYHRTVSRGHGRVDTRHYYVIEGPAGLRDGDLWEGLAAVVMAVSERAVVGGGTGLEVRYFIGSRRAPARQYGAWVRGHWGVENALHWSLDVTFDEDRCRVRKDHGAENLALLRRLALSLLSQEEGCERSIRRKQMRALLNNDYLLKVLAGSVD